MERKSGRTLGQRNKAGLEFPSSLEHSYFPLRPRVTDLNTYCMYHHARLSCLFLSVLFAIFGMGPRAAGSRGARRRLDARSL